MTRTIFRVTVEAFDPEIENEIPRMRALVAWSCLEQSVPLDPSHIGESTRQHVILLAESAMGDLMAHVKDLHDAEIQENWRTIRETQG